jgi:nucleoside-diphosphate-sugar epimerase
VFASSQAAENGGNLYADTKKICEEIAQISDRYPGGDVRVLRFANVYGGKGYLEKKNTALASFIKCRLAGEVAEVHGYGNQYRDFVHVDDVCNAIILALECDRPLLHPVDIGTGVKTPILQLARDIVQCGYTLRGDISAGVAGNVADTTRAKELLGFEAQKKIEDVMEEYE